MRTRRREARGIPAVIGCFAMGWVAACVGGGGGGGGGGGTLGVEVEEEPPALTTQVGYGVVNYWHEIAPEPFAEALSAAGLTLTGIEYVPWFEGGDCGCKLGGGCSSDVFPEEAALFVESMRARGITTYLNVVNWNSCALRGETDDWFTEQIAEIVDRIGTEKVLLNAVSEPWVRSSPAPLRWTGLARVAWSGLFSVPNDGGSGPEPRWSVFDHDYVDIHHCRDDDLVHGIRSYDPDRLHSTDCSPIVNPGPTRAAEFTREALENGAHLFIYGFDDTEPDLELIEAMGDAVRAWWRTR